MFTMIDLGRVEVASSARLHTRRFVDRRNSLQRAAVAFTSAPGGSLRTRQPPKTERQNDRRSDDPKSGRGEGRGAEIRHRKSHCSLMANRQYRHRECECAKPDRRGSSRLGMSAAWNIDCAMGTSTKNATKTLTPPYVTTADAITTERIVFFVPSFSLKTLQST